MVLIVMDSFATEAAVFRLDSCKRLLAWSAADAEGEEAECDGGNRTGFGHGGQRVAETGDRRSAEVGGYAQGIVDRVVAKPVRGPEQIGAGADNRRIEHALPDFAELKVRYSRIRDIGKVIPADAHEDFAGCWKRKQRRARGIGPQIDAESR